MKRIVRFERIRDPGLHAKRPIWLVTFTDLIMLLLAFFILMYAVSKPREQPWHAASQSIRMRFGGEESMTVVTGNPGHAEADKTWLATDNDPGLDTHYLYSLLQKKLAADPQLKDVMISETASAVMIALPVSTTFKLADDGLSERGRSILARLVPILAPLPNMIEVVGHTDENSLSDDRRFGSNWHLSLARAYSVANAMADLGYSQALAVTGRGATDINLLPKNLPSEVRNEMARRVDLRLTLAKP